MARTMNNGGIDAMRNRLKQVDPTHGDDTLGTPPNCYDRWYNFEKAGVDFDNALETRLAKVEARVNSLPFGAATS